MTRHPLLDAVADYYEATFKAHGATPRGADWKSVAAQEDRFAALLTVIDSAHPSILDYGCGWGSLFEFLGRHYASFDYAGFDISAGMVDAARERSGVSAARWLTELPEDETWDYVLASGIFNVKLNTDETQWEESVLSTLREMDRRARRGFAFNALTGYSDPDRRAQHLYYADPCRLFDECVRHFSRTVTLLHDRPPWDFTIVVRKPG